MKLEGTFDGFMMIVALIYLLAFLCVIAKALYDGFKIGQVERQEYKERKKNWKKAPVRESATTAGKLELAEAAGE
jgi:hypothetical protein